MVIVYESKTGFTRKYAEMLEAKTGFKVFHVSEVSKVNPGEEIIFLGWIKVGRIQGLDEVRKYNVVAVCGSGTARSPEPDIETVLGRNNIQGMPFFYLRGGCKPLKEIKGIDRILLAMFVKILKMRKDKDEKTEEAIAIIENGFDGVKVENLEPLLEWINKRVHARTR